MKVKNRIKRNVDFNKVIDEGSVIKADSLTMYFMKNNLDRSRIGISIPKKSGHAVLRNKMRRQIRAIVGQTFDLTKSIDYVFVARKKFDVNAFEKTKADIVYLIGKVG